MIQAATREAPVVSQGMHTCMLSEELGPIRLISRNSNLLITYYWFPSESIYSLKFDGARPEGAFHRDYPARNNVVVNKDVELPKEEKIRSPPPASNTVNFLYFLFFFSSAA